MLSDVVAGYLRAWAPRYELRGPSYYNSVDQRAIPGGPERSRSPRIIGHLYSHSRKVRVSLMPLLILTTLLRASERSNKSPRGPAAMRVHLPTSTCPIGCPVMGPGDNPDDTHSYTLLSLPPYSRALSDTTSPVWIDASPVSVTLGIGSLMNFVSY